VSFDSIRCDPALATVDLNNRSGMTLITATKPWILLAADHPDIRAETASLLPDHEATVKMQRSCPFFDRNPKMTAPGKSSAAHWTNVLFHPEH